MKPPRPSPAPRRPSPAIHIRVPAFAPVPLRYRADGWTPGRQADFLGSLAETRSVAAAWDAVMPRWSERRLSGSRKVTPSPDFHRAFYGTLKPVMRGSKHVATLHSTSNDAALRLYRQDMATRRLMRRKAERSQVK
ncbi:MAG TPA: hypothetical protein VI381_04505 [Allosphingosinicella sp.]